MKSGRFLLFSSLIIILSIFFIHCAKVAAPPGGPEDKTGPMVLSVQPADQAVNVAGENKITIRFSEAIDKKSVEDAIFITPRPEGRVKFKWKGHRLIVILPEEYAANTTYIVNLGANTMDLRKNKMDSSFTLAFSTGDEIDQGKITGTVYRDGKPATGATVALYDADPAVSLPAVDSTYPPFLTQSGKDGRFQLAYLPEGRFFLIAFDDKNKDQLLNVAREAFGVPDRLAQAGGDSIPSNIDIHLTLIDTTTVSLISATVTEDRLIKVRFSREIETDLIRENPEKIFIYDTVEDRSLTPSAVKEKEIASARSFSLYFDDLPQNAVRLKFDRDIFGLDMDSLRYLESPTFKIDPGEDNNPPLVESFSHDGKTIFPGDNKFALSFSEPCRISPGIDSNGTDAFLIMDRDSIFYEYEYDRTDVFTLDITVPYLTWGRGYTMIADPSMITDLSGNAIGDSVILFNFKTYDEDSLGSISGSVTVDSALSGRPYLFVKDITGREFINAPVPDGTFEYQLPPGKYLLSGFLDGNGNGVFDYGSLDPFKFSETFTHHPDTVRVRARFESAGVEVNYK
jgi:hypothetical protein